MRSLAIVVLILSTLILFIEQPFSHGFSLQSHSFRLSILQAQQQFVCCLRSAPSNTADEERKPLNMLDAVAEEEFLQQCKKLCEERNLKLDKVKNARDLASVRNSPVQPNRLFRMGRVGDATENDIRLLLDELQIKTLVDLRSPTELKDDPALLRDAVFGTFTDIVWKERGFRNDGCLRRLDKGQSPVRKPFWNRKKEHAYDKVNPKDNGNADSHDDDDDDPILLTPLQKDYPVTFGKIDDEILDAEDEEEECMTLDCPDDVSSTKRKERHFVSLMNEFKYVKGTVSKLRKRDITKAVLKSPGAMFSRRMRASLKKPFLDEINDGGLPMLNELLLRFGAPGIRYVLQLCADRERHPITFYCTAGKDRTGMIAAIILGLCGVQVEDIVEDYTLSANVYAEMNDHQAMVGALSQRNLDPKTFLGAPASVMRDTLQAVNENYGSVEGYCEWLGFGPDMQMKLRRACMDE